MLFPEKLEKEESIVEGIIFANSRIRELEQDLIILTDLLNSSLISLLEQLNDKQKDIFLAASGMLILNSYSLNKLSKATAKKLKLTFSSTKWNLTKLREIGLFETAGQRGNTKTKLVLTQLGDSLYSFYSQNIGNLLEHK